MRILAAIALVTLSAGAAYTGLFIYIKNTNEEIAELSNAIDQQIQVEERLRSIENIMTDTVLGRATLDGYFVGQDDIVQFIETVEALSELTGEDVTIVSVDVDEGDSVSAYQFLRLRLTTKGVWEETVHFLALLEALPNYVIVDRGNLKLRLGDEGAEEWEGSFDIRIAMLK